MIQPNEREGNYDRAESHERQLLRNATLRFRQAASPGRPGAVLLHQPRMSHRRQHGRQRGNADRRRTTVLFIRLLSSLESPQSRRTDHFSNIVADRKFSTGCYLFTVSSSGLLFYTKRVSTTPSQLRPLPSSTTLGS